MNWILEVYGDAYNSILLQNRRQESLSSTERMSASPMPVLDAVGRLLGKC